MKFSFKNIDLSRGGLPVLDGLGLKLSQGESVLISGANGAGKSSLLLYLAGLLTDARNEPVDEEFSEQCLLIESTLPLKRDLSVWENMQMWFSLWDENLCRNKNEFDAVLKLLGLQGLLDVPVKSLSSGQQKKIWYAQLWFRSKPIWLLDEPSTNLDKETLKILAALFKNHCATGGIIICAEHQIGWFPFDKEIKLDKKRGA